VDQFHEGMKIGGKKINYLNPSIIIKLKLKFNFGIFKTKSWNSPNQLHGHDLKRTPDELNGCIRKTPKTHID
jgi:hypothetical protein